MKLVPIKPTGTNAPAAHGTADAGHLPGRITVAISPEKQQLIGLRQARVERRNLSRVIRATATFEHDETRLNRVAPRFGGWISKLHANFTGQHVEKGDPLLTVYSPELLAAENEYLVAWRRLSELEGQANHPQIAAARSLLESARRRLELWEIAETDIAALQQRGTPADSTLLRAPVTGHVLTKQAVEGRSFVAGEALYEIADLSRLWLRVALTESDLPLVRTGQTARIHLPYLRDETMEGTVSFVYPHIDPLTRRGAIRIELDNPRHRLRPDMWAQVEIDASYGEALTVPASAIIDTGPRFVAFVLRPDHHLEPREVDIGVRTDEFLEVRQGLKEGEEVVTRALFLVDAESQLKAALAGMGTAGGHQH
jgi:Cu(I)/Ag(I) efflux system membrane fusion protein